MTAGRNRLTDASSPYLLQHAGNPVHWWEWGRSAFDEARSRDVPVLLSIGYAACHWCHVMAHESFEDEGVAALMNRDFVCIKVDREERPDVDAIYMDAVQAMTGHGGWPLTAFLTHDGRPFYAGTYFPPEDRHGLPGFPRLLGAIAEAWRERRAEAEEQAASITLAIGRESRVEADGGPLDAAILDEAVRRIVATFDTTWGGFGPAPKFPQPMVLEFLLRRAVAGDGAAREPLLATLDAMAAGGIFDQVGGGFHRYSTDARWLVPHFEKMLYDGAQLARLYLRAWQVYGRPHDRRVALATCDQLVRDLQRPEGGFSSSLDADTEGVEGRFYVWSWDEIVGVVGEDAARALGASPGGNWEGTNVLTCADLDADLDDAREALRLHRAARVDPATDDKVLAGWNGLAIGALAEAGAATGRGDLLEEARRAAAFVLDHLVDEDGRLHRSWRNGRLGPLAVSDDHALLADSLLTLHGRTGESRWLVAARDLIEDLLGLFEDPERGGFFSTGRDAEPLLLRPKDLQDNAVPGGNSAAAEVLLRMASLCGEVRYARAAVSALALVRPVMATAPRGFGTALCALDRHLAPPREVAVVGEPDDPATRALLDQVVARRFLPDVALAVAAPHEAASLSATVALLEGRGQVGGAATAYVCERFACLVPVTDPDALGAQLDGRAERPAT